MVKHIYFDKEYPEFHNYRVLDVSRNKSELYDGRNWIVGKADDGMIKIFENVNTTLTEPFDEENINKTIRFIEKHDELLEKAAWINWSKNYCLKLWKEDDEEYMNDRKQILDKLKLIFYNYRDQILAS